MLLKPNLLILCVLILNICSSVSSCQEMILKNIINDSSIQVFFDEKDTIPLVKNEHCMLKAGDEIVIDDKEIVVFPRDTEKPEVLAFSEYSVTDSTIAIKLSLFSKNVIYSATYKKQNGRIEALSQSTKFIKREE